MGKNVWAGMEWKGLSEKNGNTEQEKRNEVMASCHSERGSMML